MEDSSSGESWATGTVERRVPVSPYARLNLLRNPFGQPPPEVLPGLVVADVEGMAGWLARPRRALQLIGECGRGKTARMQALRAELGGESGGAPYVYLAEGERIPPLPRCGRLLLDEGQRLPRRRRRRLFRSLDSLAVATHEDLEPELEVEGWSVRTVRVEGLDRDTLAAVIDRRLEWARRGPGPLPRPTESELGTLVERFGDDLRSILDHLYEVWQARVVSEAERVRGSVSAIQEGEADGEV